MRVAFLTEMGFEGKIPKNHPNMRTEFAWMQALNADHHNIHHTEAVRDYDHVFVIFPKGRVFLSAEGTRMVDGLNPVSNLLQSTFIDRLKEFNKKVHYVQEGPHWWFNDYELADQIGFYNMLISCYHDLEQRLLREPLNRCLAILLADLDPNGLTAF